MKNKIIALACAFLIFGCKQGAVTEEVDIQETAQQIGDIMASVDEAGGSSGSLALNNNLENYRSNKTFARFKQEGASAPLIANLFVSKAQAVSCLGNGFGSCSGRTLTRSFNECTIGTGVVSGDVTLVWAGSGTTGCVLGSGSTITAGDTITRSPNFTITGRRGAVLSVIKSGTVGQRLTYVGGVNPNMIFNFSNDGIRRRFTMPDTSVLFDQTTTVTIPITVTGNARTNRVMNGGFLQVTNNFSSVVCNYTPSNVTWNSSSCNCPTQGSWSGSCSDGNSSTLEITGCGIANYTEGSNSTSVTFDRCGT